MNSFRRHLSVTLLLLASTSCAFAAGPEMAAPNSKPLVPAQQARLIEGYGKLPLSFEANHGQTNPQVKFLSRGDGYSLFLTSSEAVLSMQSKNCSQPSSSPSLALPKPEPLPCKAESPNSVLHMKLLGSNTGAQMSGEEELPGKSNYFVGNDESKWRTGLPTYSKVRYEKVYPGVDLIYYGNRRQLEFDLIVQPGADLNALRLSFQGSIAGKPVALRIDKKGDLLVDGEAGTLLLPRPIIYQSGDGATNNSVKRRVDGSYVLTGMNEVGFRLGAYDKGKPLVIDPTLAYSTLLGGSSKDIATSIAVDEAGNAYVSGTDKSSDFPTTPGAFQTSKAGTFIAKLNATGSALIYSTHFGGTTGSDNPAGIAVDAAGDVYVAGVTLSSDFPTTLGAFQRQSSFGFGTHTYIAKLDSTGSRLIYSTLLYGAGDTMAQSFTIDPKGYAYVTGHTFPDDFPITPGAFQTTPGSLVGFNPYVGYVTKLNQNGSALVYSTFLGGAGTEGDGIAVDASGNAYVTGFTYASNGFPITPGAISNTGNGFVTKFNSTGSGLIYSTLLPGLTNGNAIAVDLSGAAYIAGFTEYKFVTPGAFDTKCQKNVNAFVAKLNPSGTGLGYSTCLGGNQINSGTGIALDASGNAYITGYTQSLNFPTTPDALQAAYGGGAQDTFFTKLNSTGSALLYSTYLGGKNIDGSGGIALDPSGSAYIVGYSFSADFPTTPGAFQSIHNGASAETFIAKFSSESPADLAIGNTPDLAVIPVGGNITYTIVATNNGPATVQAIITDTLAGKTSLISCSITGGGACVPGVHGVLSASSPILAPGESATMIVRVSTSRTFGDYNQIVNTAAIASSAPDNVPINNMAVATTTVRETADLGIAASLVDSTNGVLHYALKVTNLGPDNAHAVLLLDPLPAHAVFVSASTTLGSCSFHPTIGTYGSLRCPVGNPAAGSSVQVDVVLQAFSSSCPAVTNTATLTSQSIDPNSGNDSATIVTQLPQTLCNTVALPQYKISLFSFDDVRGGARYLNNNGDLAGFFPNSGFTYYIYKNGASGPLMLPFRPHGLNDLGDVVGSTFIGVTQNFLYKNGQVQKLNFGPQFATGFPVAINNLDQIAGITDYTDTSSTFIYQNGAVQDIGHFPNGGYAQIRAINNKGEAAGDAKGSYGPRAFLYTHGHLLDATPNASTSQAYGVDSSGRVAGSFTTKGKNKSQTFIYSGGKLHDLGPDPNVSAGASAINDCGELVGTDSKPSAFLYTHGGFVPLDSLFSFPAGLFNPIAINDRGQILGTVSGYGALQNVAVALLTPLVLEKCGSDATIDNNPDSATIAAGSTITYTIQVKNLDTAPTPFTVTDELDLTTTFVSCTVNGDGGSCTGAPGSHALSAALPSLAKGSTATITVQVRAASTYNAGSVIMNTATLSSSLTADYLSTAYTSVP